MLKKFLLLGTTTPPLVNPGDASFMVTKRLLPFVQNQNTDATLMMGLIAIYVEDDLETGLALLEYGSTVLSNPRATHELGNMLARDESESQSHVTRGLNLLESQHLNEAAMEIETIRNARLGLLMEQKPSPPRAEWTPVSCGHQHCLRQTYSEASIGECTAWLQTKSFSEGWLRMRRQVQACCRDGFPSTFFDPQTFFFVPDMLECQRCRNQLYCGRACQELDWTVHKPNCMLFVY